MQQQSGFPVPDLAAINSVVWRSPAAVSSYRDLRGYIDPGEKAALEYFQAEMQGQPLLDIGVGAGRTTEALRDISQDYIGIDYTPEMVHACRDKHPDAAILQMDARDLGAFADGQFALAVFSFNGIDTVGPADRLKVLSEVHRVLRPGGLFFMSALNRHGPAHGEKPRLRLRFNWNPLRLGWEVWRRVRSLPRSWRNYRRYRPLKQTHDEWSVMACAAHDFGIIAMYTSLVEQKRQLEATGFRVELVLDNVAGRPVQPDADTSGIWWFHYLARKV